MLRNEKGFTLIEIMLSLTILAVVATITLQIVSNSATQTAEAKVHEQATVNARKMMELLTSDLRDAGFGVFLNDLSNVSVNSYFDTAFESIWSGDEKVSDGTRICALKMGTEISSVMPASSSVLNVKSVDAFLPYENGYALVYQNGEFQILHISKILETSVKIQHNQDKTKWRIPAGSPVYRVDKIEWIPSGETVTRKVNGFVTHTFNNVRLLSFQYILRDGTVVDSLTSLQAANLMCVDVELDMYLIGGRGPVYMKTHNPEDLKHHVILRQRVSPRNL